MEGQTLYEREEATARTAQALRSLHEGVAAGRTQLGSLLLISGAAGLGKTALIEDLRRSSTAASAGLTIASARGGELLRDTPFTVVRGLLQPVLAKIPESERRDLFGTWYDLVAPALGLCPPPKDRSNDPIGVRTALSWVVSQLATRQGGLVITVDDMHWADPESLAWIVEFATTHLQQLPVLIVLAYRPGELPDEARSLIGLHADQVEVEPLGQAGVLSLLRAEFGDVTQEVFANECWIVTGGNPYELFQLIGRLKDRGAPPTEESVSQLRGMVAAGKGDAIVRALETSGTETYRFAQAAAVLDHEEFTVSLAATIAVVSDGSIPTVVEKLREARILTRTDPPAFVHPTVATAIYQRMSPATKTAMHGQAVPVLLNAGKPLSAVSRHLIEIHPDDDPLVVEQLRAAAVEHLAVGAPTAAVRCLERALEEPPLSEDYAMVRFELGRAQLLTNPAATVGHLRAALDARDGLDADQREQAVLRLGQALGHLGRMDDAIAVTAGELASPAFDGDRGRTLRLQAAYYLWKSFLREESTGDAQPQRLAEISDSLTEDDPASRAVQVLRAWDHSQRGADYVQTLQLAEAAWAEEVNGRLAEGIGWTNTTWGFEIPILLGLVYAYNDRLDIARDLFHDAYQTFEVAGWSGGHQAFAAFMGAFVQLRWGNLAEAERLLDEVLVRSDRLGRNTPLEWDTVGALIETLISRGRVEDAWQLAEARGFRPPFPRVTAIPDAPTVYGRLLLARGLTDQGIRQLEGAGAQLDRRGWKSPVWAPWKGQLALALLDKDPERARLLAQDERMRAERLGTNSAIGAALRVCGLVAEREQDQVDLLRESVERLVQSPVAHELALSLVEYGSALRRIGQVREAVDQLEQGESLAVALGADSLAERARTERAATGLPHRQPRRALGSELTASEREVAVRAARGETVGHIAVSTRRSVSVVRQLLASVYRKLGTGPDGLTELFGPDALPHGE